MLGACFGAPVLLGGGGAPGAGRPQARAVPRTDTNDRWTRALAAFRRAEARLAAFRQAETRLPPAARAFPACEPLEERFNDLECARLGTLRRLLRAPAPDLPALARKIALAIDDQAWELTGAGPCLAALKADARRLARGG
ncbi:MAG TPA: hypothetical protein VES64_09045 [Allosphingosinicella sp.]|nr:hypothetical protein [Allosphingosinicella sp.]